MASEDTGDQLEDRGRVDGVKPTLDEPSIVLGKTNKPATKRSGVPLRMRQLPASFWREPNRPKADLTDPISSLTLAYLGQCYKNERFNYSDFPSPTLSYRTRLPSAVPLTNRNEPMSDYLYRNYALKHHQSSAKLTDVPWTCAPFQQTSDKLFSHSHTGLSPNPYSLNLNSHRRTSVPRCGEFGTHLVSRSDLPPGYWDSFNLGQYPTHSSQQTVSPWRPIASKTSPSYPARYHPFVV